MPDLAIHPLSGLPQQPGLGSPLVIIGGKLALQLGHVTAMCEPSVIAGG
jgi:hypothetical protein